MGNIVVFNQGLPATDEHIEGMLAKIEITYLERLAIKSAIEHSINYLQIHPVSQLCDFGAKATDPSAMAKQNRDTIILLQNALAKF